MIPQRNTYRDLEQRLIAGVRFAHVGHEALPCWIWIRHTDRKGYPKISLRIDGKHQTLYAHRLSYETFRGEKIKPHYQLDHVCLNPSCINPMHLEAVPLDENRARQGSRTGTKQHKGESHG